MSLNGRNNNVQEKMYCKPTKSVREYTRALFMLSPATLVNFLSQRSYESRGLDVSLFPLNASPAATGSVSF